jgi:hypothetical protein
MKKLLEWLKENNLDVRKYRADNWEENQENPYFLIEWLMDWGFDSAEAARIESHFSD